MDETILIVEDQELGPGLKALVEGEGLKVILCTNLNSTVNELKYLDPPPLLAIVDLKLSNSLVEDNRDGLDLLQNLQDSEVYVVVLSGYLNERSVINRTRDLPVVLKTIEKADLAKEFGLMKFMDEVRKALAIAKAAREAEGFLPAQQRRLSTLLP